MVLDKKQSGVFGWLVSVSEYGVVSTQSHTKNRKSLDIEN